MAEQGSDQSVCTDIPGVLQVPGLWGLVLFPPTPNCAAESGGKEGLHCATTRIQHGGRHLSPCVRGEAQAVHGQHRDVTELGHCRAVLTGGASSGQTEMLSSLAAEKEPGR